MYLTKTPKILKSFSKDLVWNIPTEKKELFLTFDDGPTPDITLKVLDILDGYQAKASFFCVGENILRHPDIKEEILKRNHSIGNHTHTHKNGWKTSKTEYLKDYLKCSKVIGQTSFFRPPYGRILPNQIQALKNRTKIVMWDVLSGDFDLNLSPEKCAQNVIQKATSGSIIVFHDSIKSKERVLHALPKVLDHFSDYEFCNLNRLL